MNTAVAGLYGSLTVNADGTYTYVPNAAAINALHDGSYTDTFTVQTTDVHGAIATAVLTVDVTGANDTPSIVGEVDPPAQVRRGGRSDLAARACRGRQRELARPEHGDVRWPRRARHRTTAPVVAISRAPRSVPISRLPAMPESSVGTSSVRRAPFVGPSPGHKDTTNYLSIGGNGTETITFTSDKNTFGLYWGSVEFLQYHQVL